MVSGKIEGRTEGSGFWIVSSVEVSQMGDVAVRDEHTFLDDICDAGGSGSVFVVVAAEGLVYVVSKW